MKNNLINYLTKIKEPFNYHVWCIDGKNEKSQNINSDTTNQELGKITLFRCNVQELLTNKKAIKILENVQYFEEPILWDNDIFIFGAYENHRLLKRQLKEVGIE